MRSAPLNNPYQQRLSALAMLALMCPAAITAQSNSYTVPPAYATKPGNSLDQEPFGLDQIRHMTFVDKSYLTGLPFGTKLYELRYRREENRLDKIFSNYEPMRRNPRVLPVWEVRLGSFRADYDDLNPRYEDPSNGVILTTVFAGVLNLSLNTPTLPPPANPANPAPFQMIFPFNVAQPLYGGGGMVVQHFAYESASRSHIYFVDSLETTPGGGGSVDLISPTSLGCPPNFNRVQGTAPNPGAGDVNLHLFGAPPNATALSYFGASSTSWGGSALPLDLTVIGLPGCKIYTDLLMAAPVTTNLAGIATLSLTIPGNPSLIGASAYNQWGVIDSRVNPALGFTFSDGVKITLGNQVGQDTVRMSVISGQRTSANGRFGYFQPNRGPVFQVAY